MLQQPSNENEFHQLKKIATAASVSLAICLSLIKLVAAYYTGSLAILSSMVDSMADVLSSLITFVAVRFASQPASYDHRYGFGKAEALSALFQSAFIAGSGIFVIYEGIHRLSEPLPLADTGWGIAVMLVSMAATFGLIVFQKYVVKKTESLAIAADSMHYMVDIITNLSIVLGLIAVKVFSVDWFDTLAALFVSVYLLFNAYKIARDAISMLLDKELSSEIRAAVIDVVKNCSFSRGIHDLRTRNLGEVYMFEFHLELDGALSLYEAHQLTNVVENEVKALFPNSQVIIHQDPAGVDEDRLDNKLGN